RFGAHHHAAAARLASLLYTGVSVDDSSGREVWSLDILHQFMDLDIPVIDIGHDAVHHLGQVMGRHVSGHTDGDSRCPVYQQVGNVGRQYGRLFDGVIEVKLVVDGVFIDIREPLFGSFF